MTSVYIGIGSNLGDRGANIRRALHDIQEAVRLIRLSAFREYDPAEGVGGNRFLNGVLQGETALEPDVLLRFLQDVETRCGRPALHRRGQARTLDLDILFYDGLVRTDPLPVLPHPAIARRLFVLEPLREIAPDLRCPVSGKTIAELCSEALDEHTDPAPRSA